MQEYLGETVGKAEKDNVLNLLARLSNWSAEYFDQPDGDFGIVLNKRNEITPFNNHQLAIVDCDCISRSLSAVEEGNFSEQFSGYHQVENRVLSLFRRRADTHRAGAHRIEL